MGKNGYKMGISKNIQQKLTFNDQVYQEIIQYLSKIDSFKGSWKSIENKEGKHLRELKKIATIESIGSSTRIEGATLTDAEVEKLLKKIKITKLQTREQQEVIGYYEALQIILDNYPDIELSERYIHQLHGILLKHSHKDQSHKGKYKTLSNQVVANYPGGVQRVIFRTTEPHLTAPEMEALIQWTNEQLAEKKLHPLLIIAVFIYEFLSIHPYQDGNGRLSRLLTTMVLMQNQYAFIQYISFENIIETRKEAYYRALMEGQKNRYKPNERIEQWILFFLESLTLLIEKLEEKYKTYSELKLILNERQQKIVQYIKVQKTAQLKDIQTMLKLKSRNTLKKDLQYLVEEGYLMQVGAGRGVRYYLEKK
jgi:Fic family protein